MLKGVFQILYIYLSPLSIAITKQLRLCKSPRLGGLSYSTSNEVFMVGTLTKGSDQMVRQE